MRITYANLKGFKRFHLAGIKEFEAEFPSPVTVIVGESGCGKSSLLSELSGFPAVRTAYEKDGRKELHIEHEGHLYKLISDFSNRVSPHSFIRDGVELNVGHTTDVQEELLVNHFGLTVPIRNLIYSKLKMCNITRAERKNLFLNINPLDLSLILSIHKASLSHYKDCRAQLQMLYTRKTDLESQMLNDEVLQQHITTKETLANELDEVEKVIQILAQHVSTLKDRFEEDINYTQSTSVEALVPTSTILANCKTVLSHVSDYCSIPRGDAFENAKSAIRLKNEKLSIKRQEITNYLENLNKEINDYHSHLDNANDRPVSQVEKELGEVALELGKYKNLPQQPIPSGVIDRYLERLEDIRGILFTFRDMPVKMLPLETLDQLFTKHRQLESRVQQLTADLNRLNLHIEEESKEIEQNKSKASIPSSCQSTTCGLRIIFANRMQAVEEKYKANLELKTTWEKELSSLTKEFKDLTDQLAPYNLHHAGDKYLDLLNLLKNGYFNIQDWDNTLLDQLNTQPLIIVSKLSDFIEGSKLVIERDKLLAVQNRLNTELQVLLKSSGASLDFLQKKVEEKEKQLSDKLHELDETEAAIKLVQSEYQTYVNYGTDANLIRDTQNLYTKGERALLVTKAMEYWKNLGKKFVEARRIISEELHKLETIVREQEVIRKTYTNEIITWVNKTELAKTNYEKIEQALSPNSGIPFKSMLKYLNALITNANCFSGQLWNYKLKLCPIEDNNNLDYNFRIEVGNEIVNDISMLSDGQTEVVNLEWILTILLQLKLLDKIPLYADELGKAFDNAHRIKLLNFLNSLIDSKYINQLFMISHYDIFTTGFTDSNVICLDAATNPNIPVGANDHVRFVYG